MRFHGVFIAGVTSALMLASMTVAARAAVIQVDLSTQTMHVESGEGSYDWPISSARSGYSTPRGTYGVQRMEAMHRSHKYHNSPMPHSIFFHGGYAIHGTYETGALGVPASHGCVRIAPGNAALLYRIVQAEGASISIIGTPQGSTRFARAEGHRHAERYASRHLRSPTALGYTDMPVETRSLRQWMNEPASQ